MTPGGTGSTPEPGLTLNGLGRTIRDVLTAPAAPPAPHHPKCDLVTGRGFCNCPTADFARQVRRG